MSLKLKKRRAKIHNAQLEFSFERPVEPDRNFHLGGKSFYFFDFDDNVAHLATPIIIFHKETGQEVKLSSGEFAQHSREIGKSGVFKDYFIDINDEKGSFRNFRDTPLDSPVKRQAFVQDVELALNQKDYFWKAPSWNCFYHATYNLRPLSVITARGHRAQTIKEGIELMVQDGHLPHSPNFLSIFPVSNPDTRIALGDTELKSSVPELKKSAIRESVEEALKLYGHNPYHRFGMSDDDAHNVELITEEMKSLKSKYPEMSFFVIQTYKDSYEKREIFEHRTVDLITRKESQLNQLNLFEL